MKERRQKKTPPARNGAPRGSESPTAGILWLTLGVAGAFSYLLLTPRGELTKPATLVFIYMLSAVGLDLFVGASRRVTLQRIAPAVVLAMLVTPGIPAAVAIVTDLMGTIAVAATSRITYQLMGQAGRSLLPATLTAYFLWSRGEPNLDTYFFAAEIFLVTSLVTRTTEPPYKSDLFLVVSYPAIGLMLRSLAELHLVYILLAVPLLFLLTTVDTAMLLRYFQLKKKLDHTETEVKESRAAQRKTELESRRKGVLLNRREQQLSLLNGLGREMDAAKASEDLGRFLIKESIRLTGAENSIALFCQGSQGPAYRIISPSPAHAWGLREGQTPPVPLQPGLTETAPWPAPLWQFQSVFLVCRLGEEGWMVLSTSDKEAFPPFLDEFFAAVGRHAGSAVLALRRLSEVRAVAKREAEEKNKVAREKEKVAEQNRNLRLLIDNFEKITEGTLASDHDLLRQGTEAIKRLTEADQVIFQARAVADYPVGENSIEVDGTRWSSHIFLPGHGPSGNLLCLAREPGRFNESQVEWCTLLQDFLDKTMENSGLHREVRASYAQLERTQEEIVLSSQWAAAGRLAANAAHELNTPLGAIRLAAEQAGFFLQKESAPEPAVQGIQSILRSVDRCRQVTDRLLITSRPVDAGEKLAEPSSHSLLEVVREAIASVQPYLRASNIKLVDHRLVSDHVVLVVLQDTYWAIVNLLKNAIDALGETTAQDKRIAVALSQRGRFVELSIADNGPGIPAELQSRLFEPFFTTKKLGQGNGLGLSLSRTNLRRWGGDLHFSETPGGGASFTLLLPLAE